MENSFTTDQGRKVASKCNYIASILARRAKRIRILNNVIKSFFGFIGILAVVATFIEPFGQLLGDNSVQIISVSVAVILILGSFSSIFISSDPPERFLDYAKYMRSYEKDINQVFSDPQLEASEKELRINELMNLARENINDVFNNWPWIEEKVSEKSFY